MLSSRLFLGAMMRTTEVDSMADEGNACHTPKFGDLSQAKAVG